MHLGDIEFGKCDVCGNENELTRTVFRYDIKCEYHSPYHFESFSPCERCEPLEPLKTQVKLKGDKDVSILNTNNLKKLD